MKIQIKKILQYLGYPLCFLIGLALEPAYEIVSGVGWGRTIQIVNSNSGAHQAVLAKKHNLADMNFIVKVDGKRVYISPDYVNYPDNYYQENLQWDITGKVVVLQLIGKRVFAYDTVTQQGLKKGDLERYQFLPTKSPVENYAPITDLDE
jgi:hypothetical protein